MVGSEGSLEYSRRAFTDGMLCGLDFLVIRVVREVDMVPIRELPCRDSTDLLALAEKIFEDLVGLEFRSL